MRVVLSMNSSLNGYIAREDGQEDWLPSAGWDEFVVDAAAFGNIVMGRQTYELVTALYPNVNFEDVDVPHKIIVTRNAAFTAPSAYTVVHSPEAALDELARRDVPTAFLIGGGKLNAEFLERDLVDEVWLTIVPYVLGRGRPFIGDSELEQPLTFLECVHLSLGRMRAKYRVEKDG